MTSIDVARELLLRTRNIGACIDSIAEPHRKVIELRNELSREPFGELDRVVDDLSAELRSIEELLSRGMVNEAWSSINVYEGRVSLMTPALRQLAGLKRGMRAMGVVASPELLAIEDMVLGSDLAEAEEALRSFGTAGSAAVTKPEAVSRSEAEERSCAICGRMVRADLDQCPFCGWEVGAPSAECPECGSTVLRSFRACPSCGKGLPTSIREGTVLPLVID